MLFLEADFTLDEVRKEMAITDKSRLNLYEVPKGDKSGGQHNS